jgi:hypothetical protein
VTYPGGTSQREVGPGTFRASVQRATRKDPDDAGAEGGAFGWRRRQSHPTTTVGSPATRSRSAGGGEEPAVEEFMAGAEAATAGTEEAGHL